MIMFSSLLKNEIIYNESFADFLFLNFFCSVFQIG